MSKATELIREIQRQENLVGSAESLELHRSIFESDAWRDLPVMESLELAWQEYAQSQTTAPDLAETRDRSSRDAIQSFTRCLEDGVIPPPETLNLLSTAFSRYLAANGDLSLDEGFFGSPHKKNSSYAFAHGSNTARMKAFSTFLAVSKVEDVRASQVNIAEEFLKYNNDDEADVETFLRLWRRWRQASNKWSE
ncbi:hypothetical protein N9W12_06825 [Luminiphilus sp.]|nr:hypothetical protein [Luminiphilus sp.]